MSRISKIFVTVDAVVLSPENNQILLIRRKNEPFKEYWALPGGFVDEGEDLPVAAARELMEETCIDAKPARQIGAFGKPGRDPRQHTVAVAYLFHLKEPMTPQAADDASEAKWFPIGKLPQLAFDHADIIALALDTI